MDFPANIGPIISSIRPATQSPPAWYRTPRDGEDEKEAVEENDGEFDLDDADEELDVNVEAAVDDEKAESGVDTSDVAGVRLSS